MNEQNPPSRPLRILAIVASSGLFVLAIARTQVGCATPSPLSRAPHEVKPDDLISSPTVADEGEQAPTASVAPDKSAAATAPSAQAADLASAEPTAKPAAAKTEGSAAPEPTWFPASKSGSFLHPTKKPTKQQQQLPNQAPQK